MRESTATILAILTIVGAIYLMAFSEDRGSFSFHPRAKTPAEASK